MIAYAKIEEVLKQNDKKVGHILLNEDNGCVNGCTCGVSLYRAKEYSKFSVHDDQEGFLVLEGRGTVYVGGEELAIEPGMCLMVPAYTEHGVKTAADCDVCKLFWFHAAV